MIEGFDEDIVDELVCWRLIVQGITTKQELDSCWTIDDIRKADDLLKFKEKLEQTLMPKIPKGKV